LVKRILFISIISIITIVYGTKPRYNWDMLGYMASILRIEESDDIIIHSKVYKIAETELSAESYTALTNNSNRMTLKNDSKAFSELIPYYSIKSSYVFLSYLFYKLGIPLTYSTVIPSLISFFLICLILFHLLVKATNNIMFGGLLTLYIATLHPMQNLVKLSTPDALSSLFLLLVVMFFLIKKHYLLLILSMIVAITVRPDNIIFCSLLLLSQLIRKKPNIDIFHKTLIGIICLFFTYFVIHFLNENHGWKILFYYTFVEKDFPITSLTDINFKIYVKTMIKHSTSLINPILLFCASSFILYKSKMVQKVSNLKIQNLPKSIKIYFVIWLTFFIRFFLFPSVSMRFYFVYFLIMVIMIAFDFKKFTTINENTLKSIV
jgi:hypothetical protein